MTNPALRPTTFADFAGQTLITQRLKTLVAAAKRRGESVGHVLLYGPPGLGKPVSVDTLILMADGTRRRMGDLLEGDRVITGSGRAQPVTAVYDQGMLDCLRLTTHAGRSVVAAPDHPFLTPLGWVKAGDLNEGDALANVLKPECVPSCHTVAGEEYRLAGYFVGNGSLTSGNKRITHGDRDVLDDIHRCAEKVDFGSYEISNSAHSENVVFTRAVPWLKKHGLLGKDSWAKRVPDFVFNAEAGNVAEFLAGYFMSDGHVSNRGVGRWDIVIEFYSVSRDLLADTQHLLLRLGIQSRISLKKGKYQGDVHLSWRLTITSQDDAARFRDAIPVIGAKGKRLQEWKPRRTKFDELLAADRIVQIERVGMVACRCISVANDLTYTVNDLVCHNTTLAGIVAQETGGALIVASGPTTTKRGQVSELLMNLPKGGVLFVDEVHSLPPIVEEMFLSAMEDRTVLIQYKGMSGPRVAKVELHPFTLIAATTRPGMLSKPFRDRFTVHYHLEYYTPATLAVVVERSAAKLGFGLGEGAANEIACRGRGTPRIANQLLRRVRDYAQGYLGVDHADGSVAATALDIEGVDNAGLEPVDVQYLTTIAERFNGGPAGLNAVAATMSDDVGTLEHVVEPYLLWAGFITRTGHGRTLTEKAQQHLKLRALYQRRA